MSGVIWGQTGRDVDSFTLQLHWTLVRLCPTPKGTLSVWVADEGSWYLTEEDENGKHSVQLFSRFIYKKICVASENGVPLLTDGTNNFGWSWHFFLGCVSTAAGCTSGGHTAASAPTDVFPIPLLHVVFGSYAGRCEQEETEKQNEWAADAAARWTREISWEIDTDKSHTLRLPGRQLSAEEAAGTISRKWHWVSLILCLQHIAARWKAKPPCRLQHER